ncbi:MAG: hypothetical protein IKI76_07070 [Selenomonadaceae bacterium]|nr:hypothetical protein [Selenomonadaceae bacterium]
MHRLSFTLKTLSPIVLSSASNSTVMTETHSAFSGSIVRGILASRFAEVNHLDQTACTDEAFREIFYGGVKFLAANPDANGRRAIVLPLSLQKGKDGTSDANTIQDLLDDKDSRQGYKSFRGFGVLNGNEVSKVSVGTNIFMHMSRSGDKERLAGRSVDGQIYNYEAIDAEQTFRGELLGEEKILRRLLDGLDLDGGRLIAYVGRSRFTQYGKCLMTFDEIKPVDKPAFTDKIFLRLETPLIPLADCFLTAKEILRAEVLSKLGDKFSLGEVFASCVDVENFVVLWGMKRPRVMALAAGSVFELNATNLTEDDKKLLAEKILAGFGSRTEEGFGQLRLWTPTQLKLVKPKTESTLPARPKKFSDYTIELAKKILRAHLLEQVRLYAFEDAKELQPQLEGRNLTHLFKRLDVLLSNTDKKNLRKNFAEQIGLAADKAVQFKENLEQVRMGNRSFYKVFTGAEEFTHGLGDLMTDTTLEKVRGVIDFKADDFTDDDFAAEYLKHYFRSARKVSKGGEPRE